MFYKTTSVQTQDQFHFAEKSYMFTLILWLLECVSVLLVFKYPWQIDCVLTLAKRKMTQQVPPGNSFTQVAQCPLHLLTMDMYDQGQQMQASPSG